MITILTGDALEKLRELPDESVQCCVTSPPYWGLRDYGTAQWEGGDAGCDHSSAKIKSRYDYSLASSPIQDGSRTGTDAPRYKDSCDCGARRIDSQLGLEKTPEEYVAKMVEVFREVKRVLRKDGTLWLNMGDSYTSTSGNLGYVSSEGKTYGALNSRGLNNKGDRIKNLSGLKPKDLCGIPWTLAKALQAPYYTGKIKSELDRVWLAATIDAEGTICGFHHERKDGDGIRTGVHIAITNTNRAMLDNAFRIWPTSKDQHNAHGKGHFGKLDIWRWIAHDVDEKSLLMRELYPHLIAKKKQCLLAYNFFELSKNAKRLGKGGEAESTRAKRSMLIHAISKLNHLEPADIPSWCVEPPSLFEDGWWLRSDNIWAKPNPMPESVTDRPTKSHEYIFLLTKSANYFYDAEAIKEKSIEPIREREKYNGESAVDTKTRGYDCNCGNSGNRNKRSVWTIATQPYPEAHFATFPEEIPKLCILAGTSAKGACAKCGAPWERIVKASGGSIGKGSWHNHEDDLGVGQRCTEPTAKGRIGRCKDDSGNEYKVETLGWQPTCECGMRNAECGIKPCTVLDPFAGSGTTGAVALELGRKAILIELNPSYCALIRQRCDVTPGLALA